jgi:hypothetical protein
MSLQSRLLLPAALGALLLAAPAARADQPFDAPHAYAVGTADPRSLAAVDLDGDGHLDLVAGDRNGDEGAVSVLRNTGHGSFSAPPAGPFAAGVAGAGVGAIAAGDLNGDGRPDVLAALETGSGAGDQLVLFAGDGTGALSVPGFPITTRGDVSGVALADLDGDGVLDALTSHHTATTSDELAVLPGAPGGVFALDTSYGAGTTTLATGLATGQLDGAAGPDALVISAGPSGGTAWVATHDAPGFALTPASIAVPVGADPVAVALADVDGDGDLDGLVLDGTAATVTLLTNDGTGGLTPTDVAVPGLGQGSGLATGDLDGDGDADLVVTDALGSQAGVLLNDGHGDFGDPEWLPMGAAARAPVVADFTGDGVPDLATADAVDGTVSVRAGTGVPAPQGALTGTFADQVVGRTGEVHTITVTDGGQAQLPITGVATTGDASDDFLITGDGCTGTTVRSGGTDGCTVRVRFAPSAAGVRAAALRVRYAGGTLDVPLSATGLAATDDGGTTDPGDGGAGDDDPGTSDDDPGTTDDGATDDPDTTTPTTVVDPAPTPPAVPTPTPTPAPAAKKTTKTKAKTKPLTLTVTHAKLTAKPGARLPVAFTLGRAAKLVLRVKHGGRTTDIVRASGRSGRGTITWDGKLGKQAAPSGTYRLDLYAVAADGRAARASTTLTVRV